MLGSGQQGVDLRVDTLILFHQLGCEVVKLVLVLVVDGWEEEGTKPRNNEEGECVEDSADKGDDVQEDGELEGINVVFKENQAFGLESQAVNSLRSRPNNGLDLLSRQGDLDISHEVKRVTAGLLEESHEMNVNTRPNSKHENCQGEVGKNGEQGEFD